MASTFSGKLHGGGRGSWIGGMKVFGPVPGAPTWRTGKLGNSCCGCVWFWCCKCAKCEKSSAGSGDVKIRPLKKAPRTESEYQTIEMYWFWEERERERAIWNVLYLKYKCEKCSSFEHESIQLWKECIWISNHTNVPTDFGRKSDLKRHVFGVNLKCNCEKCNKASSEKSAQPNSDLPEPAKFP